MIGVASSVRIGLFPNNGLVKTEVFVDAFADVLSLGESFPIQPATRVTNFPTGVLNVADHPVKRSSSAERKQVCSGFAEPKNLLPDGD